MRVLRTAGMVVAAVALVATGVGIAAGGAAAAAAGSATAATALSIGTYASLGAGILSMATAFMAPKMGVEGSATTFATNPQSGLPYAIGRTRMSGLRVYARTYDGFKQQSKHDILAFVALLSIAGPIHSIEQFTADNEAVTFSTNSDGDANGRFYRYMAQKLSLGASSGSALAMTFGGKPFPEWTANHKLSGIAHAQWALRFDTDGDLFGAGAPEPAWIGKWVKVYDPRKDSTYPGGSGSHRALNEATYEWSDNPGLHALTWALGRWQNGKRVCGIGAPVSTIRVAEFVECANVCDANGWKVGGVEWTTDSKWDTLKRILQAGGAIPTQTGAMIGCLTSTPRTAIATIESRHLLDGLSIAATKSRRDRFNSVIPRYVDEDSDWAVISGTAVTVADYVTADGGQRTKEVDFPLVQVFSGDTASQPGQLAAYAVVNSREAGPFTWTTGPEWIGLKTGDVVYLNVPEEGLVNQPVLITRRAPDPATGKVSFAGETETYSKHAYALGQTTTPPKPFRLSAPDLKPPAPLAENWTVTGVTSGEGFPALQVVGASEMPSADAIVIDYRKTGDEPWTGSAILSAVEPVEHVIAPLESETAYDVRIAYRVGTALGNMTMFVNVVTGLGKITIIEGQLSQIDVQMTQLEQDAAAAQTAINAAQADIDAAVADIAAQGSAIETIEQNVATNSGDIELLVQQIDALSPQGIVELSNKLGVMATTNEAVAGALLAATIKTSESSASFSSERTIRANAHQVIARAVDAMGVRMGAAEAGISTEQTVRATADTALSNQLNTVSASVDANSAAITAEVSARATGDASLSNQINSVTATVNGHTVSITNQSVAIGTAQGDITTLFGRAALTVDVNGRITGYEIDNNGTVGSFTIRSDRFRVLPPSGTTDGFYIDIDGSNRTTQYIRSGSVRVVELGWIVN
ncbi:Phage tail protein [Sphingobium herbicidovorans NBRC 16415]|uniref:Phage tail protein n=1 Tax=Sphingobium herbicidovorans (strain ATCC 700291 / DSM 11019 / CCUG 56400 / KCTC 2939 / LMG 18315 / NBRC 16415 / MH) TaxID=1219045 RepID=A0A086PEB3_SPHHM|nr:phage tail protein [Sphingobium herbicidovorans]KFG91731.1 Phage tail protein [Sphingobium herbicidovorans NBRC 16415]